MLGIQMTFWLFIARQSPENGSIVVSKGIFQENSQKERKEWVKELANNG